MSWKYWLMTAAGLIVVEILPPATHFFVFCMALGALGASITALYSSSLWLPWLVFVCASIALMPLMIPLAKFLFAPRGDMTPKKD